MNKNLHASIFIFVLMSTVYYPSAQARGSFSKYIGFDGMYSSMKFRKDYGDNIFNHNAIPGINLFIGHMFNENWSIEAGYEAYKNMQRKNVVVYAGQLVAGAPVAPGLGFECYNTQIKQQHTYVGGVGRYKLNSHIFGTFMLGISLSGIYAKFHIFDDGTPATVNVIRNFNKIKLIPLIKLAANYKFSDNLGFRAITSWKKTSEFTIVAKQATSTSKVKLKNTINVGIGTVYYFN